MLENSHMMPSYIVHGHLVQHLLVLRNRVHISKPMKPRGMNLLNIDES